MRSSHKPEPGLPSSDALVALLTVESLLFAALALAGIFLTTREHGWDLAVPVNVFGWGVTIVIGLVALGAASSWADVYLRSGLGGAAIASGVTLLIGIVAVPAMAAWVAHAVARNAATA